MKHLSDSLLEVQVCGGGGGGWGVHVGACVGVVWVCGWGAGECVGMCKGGGPYPET